jgi:hypothetical protein
MRKKNRNYLAIGMFAIAAIGLFLTINRDQFFVQTNQASIDYWIGQYSDYCFQGGNEPITINCKNGGNIDGEFYLVVTFVNATFSNQTEPTYVQVSPAVVKVPFILHKSGDSWDHNDKQMYFSVDNGVKGFSISLSLEKRNNSPLKENLITPTFLQYTLNEQYGYYEILK